MRRGAKPPYRHSPECRSRLEKLIKKADPQRWERYCTRRSLSTRGQNSPEDSSEDEEVGEEEEAPPDDHGFPMVTALVEKLMSVDVTELFSPPRVTEQAKKFGLKIGGAYDLTTGWDFRLKSHREAAYQQVKEEKPLVVIGSPPCTPFSQLQTLNPNTENKRRSLQEGQDHMKFVISLYRLQVKGGRIFLHEHPSHARSWHMKEVRNLMKEQGVTLLESDQCMFGLKTWGTSKSKLQRSRNPRSS